jgi:hypothetical protein
VDLIVAAKLAQEMLAKHTDGTTPAAAAAASVDTTQTAEAATTSTTTAITEEALEAVTRPVLCFTSAQSYISLQGRDLEPPWTAEYWIMCDSPATSVNTSANTSAAVAVTAATQQQQQQQQQQEPAVQRETSSTSTASNSSGSAQERRVSAAPSSRERNGRPLTARANGPAQQQQQQQSAFISPVAAVAAAAGGRGRPPRQRLSDFLPSSSSTSTSSTSATATAARASAAAASDSVPAQYLACSSSGHIRVRAGGRAYSSITEPDTLEPVAAEALCVSVGLDGETEHAFDYVCPTGRCVAMIKHTFIYAKCWLVVMKCMCAVAAICMKLVYSCTLMLLCQCFRTIA